MNKDFSAEPKSISEIKAIKEDNGYLWSPRDALINVLRQIDSGDMVLSQIIICYKNDGNAGASIGHVSSGDTLVHISMLEMMKVKMILGD